MAEQDNWVVYYGPQPLAERKRVELRLQGFGTTITLREGDELAVLSGDFELTRLEVLNIKMGDDEEAPQ